MVIYRTKEYNGYGKQNYYCNEYRQEGDTVEKYKCNRRKFFDGDENVWEYRSELLESWSVNDESMPNWLNEYIQ